MIATAETVAVPPIQDVAAPGDRVPITSTVDGESTTNNAVPDAIVFGSAVAVVLQTNADEDVVP